MQLILDLVSIPDLLDLTIKATIILTIAWGLTFVFRSASASLRHWLWGMAMFGALALPVLSAILPAWNILPGRVSLAIRPAMDIGHRRGREPSLSPGVILGSSPMRSLEVNDKNQFAGEAALQIRKLISPTAVSDANPKTDLSQSYVIPIWLTGTMLLLARLAASQGALFWLHYRNRSFPVLDFDSQVHRLARRLRIKRKITLRMVPRPRMPMTFGVLFPCIVLPEEAIDWTPDRLEAVLLHELAHVGRHDCVLQWVAQLACALHWFNPLVWFAASRLGVERENACDDCVLSSGVKASDYARHLLDLASYLKPSPAAAASIAMAGATGLEHRLRTVLDVKLERSVPERRTCLVVLIAFMAAVTPLAMIQTAAETEDAVTSNSNSDAGFEADQAPINGLVRSEARSEVSIENIPSNQAPSDAHDRELRHFVRIVAGPDTMTFESEVASWEKLPALLNRVLNRTFTVLEIAISTEQISVAKMNEATGRAMRLASSHGFEYSSYIGVHPLGSKGSPTEIATNRGKARPGTWTEQKNVTITREDWKSSFFDLEKGAQANATFTGGFAGIPDAIDLSFPVLASKDGKLSRCIVAIGMRVVRLNGSDLGLDTGELLPRDVERILAAAPEQRTGDEPPMSPLLGPDDPDSGIFAFRTQEGRSGILKASLDRESGSVTMRYSFIRE